MKLDLRPRKLVVKLGMDESAKVGMVKEWFQVRTFTLLIRIVIISLWISTLGYRRSRGI